MPQPHMELEGRLGAIDTSLDTLTASVAFMESHMQRMGATLDAILEHLTQSDCHASDPTSASLPREHFLLGAVAEDPQLGCVSGHDVPDVATGTLTFGLDSGGELTLPGSPDLHVSKSVDEESPEKSHGACQPDDLSELPRVLFPIEERQQGDDLSLTVRVPGAVVDLDSDSDDDHAPMVQHVVEVPAITDAVCLPSVLPVCKFTVIGASGTGPASHDSRSFPTSGASSNSVDPPEPRVTVVPPLAWQDDQAEVAKVEMGALRSMAMWKLWELKPQLFKSLEAALGSLDFEAFTVAICQCDIGLTQESFKLLARSHGNLATYPEKR